MAPGQSCSFCFWVLALSSTWATTGHVCPRWVRVQSWGLWVRGTQVRTTSSRELKPFEGAGMVGPPVPGETGRLNPRSRPCATARLLFAYHLMESHFFACLDSLHLSCFPCRLRLAGMLLPMACTDIREKWAEGIHCGVRETCTLGFPVLFSRLAMFLSSCSE